MEQPKLLANLMSLFQDAALTSKGVSVTPKDLRKLIDEKSRFFPQVR